MPSAFLRRHAVQSSRSFAVIQQPPAGCCIDICVFYLVLSLDTVEDDMTFYAGTRRDLASRRVDSRHRRDCFHQAIVVFLFAEEAIRTDRPEMPAQAKKSRSCGPSLLQDY